MGKKVVKISQELYDKVKAVADSRGITMGKALETLVEGKPLPEEVEAFVPSCAEELGVKMPTNYGWIKVLAEVLPAGLRGKLEPYARVLECAEAKAELKRLAEEYLEQQNRSYPCAKVLERAESKGSECSFRRENQGAVGTP